MEEVCGQKIDYDIITMEMFQSESKELQELLPRYQYDNIFVSDKFKKHFPDFKITDYRQGIGMILNEFRS